MKDCTMRHGIAREASKRERRGCHEQAALTSAKRERAFRSSMRRLVSPDAHRWAMPVIALVMLIGIIAGASG